ncbi:MAG TPA: hypothetical protein H9965_00815 [Candidatus Streptococcus faecavium]|uniref:Uncharacterized protein n=1 Tax=Candidatus Streptococcus faecavium TaxID=2838763 RepID=A0A9D2FUN3_9STRE|nr:hypothetical protein [Candidatus Streptococcus faecavium]
MAREIHDTIKSSLFFPLT